VGDDGKRLVYAQGKPLAAAVFVNSSGIGLTLSGGSSKTLF